MKNSISTLMMKMKEVFSMEDKDYKKQIIDEITNFITQRGQQVRDSDLSVDDQVTQVDVLLDTLHFLQCYDENVKVLNKYWLEKRWKQKFSKVRDKSEKEKE